MQEYVQIYNDLNSLVSQQSALSDLGTVTPENFVDFGKKINELNLAGQFLNDMLLKRAKTIIDARIYKGVGPDIMQDSYDWGIITEWVTIDQPAAIIDEAYNIADGQSVDMYEVTTPKVNVTYYGQESKWVVKVTRYKDQLKSVFNSAETFERFWSAYDVEVENAITEQNEALSYACIGSAIARTFFDEYGTANAYKNTTSIKARNLLYEYNQKHQSDPETVETCLDNPEFIRYANTQMNLLKARMKKNTVSFNIAKRKTHTDDEHFKFWIHADYVANAKSNLYSTQFNKEDVLLPENYQELPTFQAVKNTGVEDFDFKTTSSIDQTINVLDPTDKTQKDVRMQISGLIGVMADKYACVSFNKLRETETTPLNAYGLYLNIFHHMTTNYQFHPDFNFVVFYIAEK